MTLLTKPQTPHYAFRLEGWNRLCETKAWGSIPEAARALGVADTSLYRAFSTGPGVAVMAAIMAAAYPWPHEHLFKLVVPKRKTRP